MKFIKKSTTAFALLAVVFTILVPGGAAQASERSLGGIKIFGPALAIVRKYGTPNEVRKGDIGTASLTASSQNGQTPQNFASTADNPSALPPPDAGTTTPSQDNAAANAPGLVTWVYYLGNGNMMEFVITEGDGRVIRIHITGFKSSIRTARGVTLGQTYRQVIDKYGFPENHDAGTASSLTASQNGGLSTAITSVVSSIWSHVTGPDSNGTANSSAAAEIVEAKYTEGQHVTFQFYKQRVVGILVGIVD